MKSREDPQATILRVALDTLIKLAESNNSTLVQGDITDGKGGTWHLKFEKQDGLVS